MYRKYLKFRSKKPHLFKKRSVLFGRIFLTKNRNFQTFQIHFVNHADCFCSKCFDFFEIIFWNVAFTKNHFSKNEVSKKLDGANPQIIFWISWEWSERWKHISLELVTVNPVHSRQIHDPCMHGPGVAMPGRRPHGRLCRPSGNVKNRLVLLRNPYCLESWKCTNAQKNTKTHMFLQNQ